MARPNSYHSPESDQPPASPAELVSLYDAVGKSLDPGDLLGHSPMRYPESDLPVFSDQPIVNATLPTKKIIQELPEAATHLKISDGDSVEVEYAKRGFLLGANNTAHPMDGYLAFTISRGRDDITPADVYMFDVNAVTGEPRDVRHTTEQHETMERLQFDYLTVNDETRDDFDPVEELVAAKAKSEDERRVPPISSLDVMAMQQIIEKLSSEGQGEAWTPAA